MEKQISISPETVLYLVAGTGHRQIYGIPNVFADKTEADASSIAARADAELAAGGLASMDMDGNVKIDGKLLSMISEASESKKYVAISIRNGKTLTDEAVYYVSGNVGGILMTRKSETDNYYTEPCCFEEAMSDIAIDRIIDFISLPEKSSDKIKKTTVDNRVLINVTEEKLTEAGVDADSAKLIRDCYAGDGKIMTCLVFTDGNVIDAGVWIYNNDGVMGLEVSYEDYKEFMNMSPANPAEVADTITKKINSVSLDEA